MQGTSLMPLVRGEVERVHEEIFAEVTYHAAYEPQRAVRTERWKYIRRFGSYPYTVLANCDDSASKELLVELGWGEQVVAREQLYDLALDPEEAHNLADDPSGRRCWQDMRDRLRALDGGDRRPAARGARSRRPRVPTSTCPPSARRTIRRSQGPADPERVTADPTAAPSRLRQRQRSSA